MQRFFYDILNDYGKVYIVIKHSDNTVIGRRGFSDEEKKKGLILVFTERNYKDFFWAEDGSLQATLGFGAGNKAEKCFIYADDIIAVFSPDAKIKVERWDVWDQSGEGSKPNHASEPVKKIPRNEKVISLDRFRKSRD